MEKGPIKDEAVAAESWGTEREIEKQGKRRKGSGALLGPPQKVRSGSK